jgi:hypothetical protein
MAKWFSGSGFAAAVIATRCSGSVLTAIADTAIAAPLAALNPASGNDAAPTAGTNGVRKDDWTIATGSGNIDTAKPVGRA